MNESLNGVEQNQINNLQNELDRIISFISHCDSKVSIMLGVNGIILTILFTSNKLYYIHNKFIDVYVYNHYLGCLQLLFLFLTFCGIITLIISLVAQLGHKRRGSREESLIYFGTIVNNSNFESFKDKYLVRSVDTIITDYLSQIYINSIICKKKFRSYNWGCRLLIIGWMGSVVIYCIYLFRFFYNIII